VPIQALTLRKPDGTDAPAPAPAPAKDAAPAAGTALADDGHAPAGTAAPATPGAASGGPIKKLDEKGKVEGVFVVQDGIATFRRVTVGITGEKDFEVVGGLSDGDVIVTGPFKALRTLKSGDRVKTAKKKEKKPGEDADEDAEGAKTGTSGA
jgi:HlyD family secretion protein